MKCDMRDAEIAGQRVDSEGRHILYGLSRAYLALCTAVKQESSISSVVRSLLKSLISRQRGGLAGSPLFLLSHDLTGLA